MLRRFKVLVLEPSGRVRKIYSTKEGLVKKYNIDKWIQPRLMRGETLSILCNNYPWPIGSQVTLHKRESLWDRLVRLLNTKVEHLFK